MMFEDLHKRLPGFYEKFPPLTKALIKQTHGDPF
jgi:hypothetical protein